jgi:AcrR family transcriptional regulator
MADVAAQAGVSKGTPYMYFPSKEALFIALDQEWDCRLTDGSTRPSPLFPEAGHSSPR